MLMHNLGGVNGTAVGGHAFSRDAETWTMSVTAPYSTLVQFSDGSNATYRRRERPQLLLDGDGRPLYLSTGVVDFADHSYTLVNKVWGKPGGGGFE